MLLSHRDLVWIYALDMVQVMDDDDDDDTKQLGPNCLSLTSFCAYPGVHIQEEEHRISAFVYDGHFPMLIYEGMIQLLFSAQFYLQYLIFLHMDCSRRDRYHTESFAVKTNVHASKDSLKTEWKVSQETLAPMNPR